ncbi:hypothetical protein ACIQVN_07895 [Streptomyces cyaneofuscatus]|uniref:hypothetical protein n=1 Tax=Streptomyces cyaneofuscatus TaxID=66883 RepID=UPI00382872D3
MGLCQHRPDGRAEGRCRVVHGHHDRHQGHSTSPRQVQNSSPFKHHNRAGAAMRTVVAGQGYVGLPRAVRAAEVGHRVVGYDVGPYRVQQLAAGQSHARDVDSSRLRAVLDSGAYFASADAAAAPAGFDIAVITVPSPLRDGVPVGRAGTRR